MYLNDITNVNYVGVSNGLHTNPLAIRLPLDIEATYIILSEDCEGTTILVAANSQSKVRRGARRVVVKADEAG